VVRRSTRPLPGLSACRPPASSKIIPRISRDDIDWPRRAHERPCGLAHSSPQPDRCQLQAAYGFCQDPLRVYVHPAPSPQVVPLRSQRVLTGSGSPVSSYGGLGGRPPTLPPAYRLSATPGHEHLIRRSMEHVRSVRRNPYRQVSVLSAVRHGRQSPVPSGQSVRNCERSSARARSRASEAVVAPPLRMAVTVGSAHR